MFFFSYLPLGTTETWTIISSKCRCKVKRKHI